MALWFIQLPHTSGPAIIGLFSDIGILLEIFQHIWAKFFRLACVCWSRWLLLETPPPWYVTICIPNHLTLRVILQPMNSVTKASLAKLPTGPQSPALGLEVLNSWNNLTAGHFLGQLGEYSSEDLDSLHLHNLWVEETLIMCC